METLTKLSAFLLGLLMLLATISPAFALSDIITAQEMSLASINGINAESYNWAGYAVLASSVTSVSGQLIVPATSSPAPGSATTYYASWWVGIDGLTDSTVEQTGIIAVSTGTIPTTYLAVFEFYPGPAYEIGSTVGGVFVPAPVEANDAIYASVMYTGISGGFGFGSPSSLIGSPSSLFSSPSTTFIYPGDPGRSNGFFTVTIMDITEHWTFSTSESDSSAERSSAEWITETPTVSGEIALLADFHTVHFDSCYAIAANGFLIPSSFEAVKLTMISDSATPVIMAKPSPSIFDAFSVMWASAGP
ncbi:MAG TPA: G1 family glutamic endopeptidase [Candidatus Limnocylindrales bacterium]|nr:G1 family glutamic endopeptidase [Candidatus Limnocylindrales bacterium]